MNTRKIEEIAVNSVRREIQRSKFLADEIPVNDKTPSWDGEIFVYDKTNQRKTDLFGKVPVQVKGKYVNTLSSIGISHSLEKADLNNYFKNGGVLFLKVEVVDVDNTQIYYSSLLPIDIKEILKEMKDQNTITSQFEKLPMGKRDFELICRNFIYHSRKQALPLIDASDTPFNVFSGGAITINSMNFKESLLKYGTYLYGHLEEYNLEIPLYKINIEQILEEDDDIHIGTNGIIYYEKIKRKTERDQITILFGKSFKMVFSRAGSSNESINIIFTENGSIKNRIKDCEFMIELLKHKHIEINNSPVRLDDFESELYSLKDLSDKIKQFKEMLETFKQLNISFDYPLEKLTKEDVGGIKILKDIIIYRDYSAVDLENKFVHIRIADVKVLLTVLKGEEGRIVFNVFDLEAVNNNFKIRIMSKDKQTKAIHSPFLMFDIPFLFGMSNINFKVIEKSLTQVDYENDFSVDLTNNFLLNLINYYDQSKQTPEILRLAHNIYEYLEDIGKSNNVINFLNRMQIIKRQRNFNDEEKEQIVIRKNETNHGDFIMCGFSILLESKIEFDIHFKKLSEEEKQTFQSYPIYNLINN